MTKESKQSYKCRFCNKSFAKESTLIAHVCEQKRRHQQQDERGVQLGFRAYIRFYEMSQGSTKSKTYEDFASSPYYQAFVKFGRYCVAIRCINFPAFTDWLLKNNKKLDYWCKDALYIEWMALYLQKEMMQDALERAIKEMQDYAESHPELKNGFSDYFRYGNDNRICHHITTGRISPWALYNCDSGIEFLNQLNEEQVSIVMPYIDPDFWQRRMKDFLSDREQARDILKAAGL